MADSPGARLLMDEGDVLVRDPRTVHRASPNLTAAPRPMQPGAIVSFSADIYPNVLGNSRDRMYL